MMKINVLKTVDLRTILLRSYFGTLREPTFTELYHLRKFQLSKSYDCNLLHVNTQLSFFRYKNCRATLHHAYEFLYYQK